MIQPDTLRTALPPIAYAPTVLTGTLFIVGVLVGGAVAAAVWWGVHHARRARALAAVGGQLVVVRTPDGRCEPLAVPERFAALFTAPPPRTGALPPWRPELDAALATLAGRTQEGDADSASLETRVDGQRLRLVGLRLSDDETLLVTIAPAGHDTARVNRLETAALMSGGLAHDLRNMLNTLALHADVGGLHVADPGRVGSHLERIRTGATRAADLVSLLLRQLRGMPGASTPPVEVSVADTVREVVELLRPAFPHRTVVECDDLASDAIVLVAEPVQLHQIVLNLVYNAAQALERTPAPRLRITVTREPGATPGVPDAVALTVEDNGPGMPPDVRARCFEPYFSTKSLERGSGLGLAVVRTLAVEVMGGEVSAGEAPGGGARFAVRLPAAGAASAALADRALATV